VGTIRHAGDEDSFARPPAVAVTRAGRAATREEAVVAGVYVSGHS
jgi:hypothetical protein